MTSVPAQALELLSKSTDASAMNWLAQKSQLDRLADALSAARIDCMLLKGAQLAVDVYPRPSLRPMGDIDLLVRASDLAQTAQLLTSLGYHCAEPYDLDRVVKESHALPIHVNASSVAIDLHWTIVTPGAGFNIDVDGLWSRARPSSSNAKLMAFSVEDQILHLALHTLFHSLNQSGLIVYFDFVFLNARYAESIQWEILCARAKQWGCADTLYTYLTISNELFAASVPGFVLDTLRSDNGDKALLVCRNLILIERALSTSSGVAMGVKYLSHIRGYRPGSARLNLTSALLKQPRTKGHRESAARRAGIFASLIFYPLRWLKLLSLTLGALLGAATSSTIRLQLKRQLHITQLSRLLTPAAEKHPHLRVESS